MKVNRTAPNGGTLLVVNENGSRPQIARQCSPHPDCNNYFTTSCVRRYRCVRWNCKKILPRLTINLVWWGNVNGGCSDWTRFVDSFVFCDWGHHASKHHPQNNAPAR